MLGESVMSHYDYGGVHCRGCHKSFSAPRLWWPSRLCFACFIPPAPTVPFDPAQDRIDEFYEWFGTMNLVGTVPTADDGTFAMPYPTRCRGTCVTGHRCLRSAWGHTKLCWTHRNQEQLQ